VEYAPFGVVCAITPVTNPTSTITCNGIGIVSAGNSVVFNVHPSARGVSNHLVSLLNEGIVRAGGPPNLVASIENPTIESAGALMKNRGVALIVVTGGPAVVRAAMATGKKAICAGPGNPPVVVDETADIPRAARNIVLGASLDNNNVCTDEKEVVVTEPVADALLREMARADAVILTPTQTEQITRAVFEEARGPRRHGVINKKYVGKDAAAILGAIGASCDPRARLLVAPVPVDHPLMWTEQMMPIMPVARVADADAAIDLAKEMEHGYGHTAVMHSKNIERLSRMARVMDTCIFVKNGPAYAGLGYGGEGPTSFTIAHPTGDGLTDARTFSRLRRCTLVDYFRIV
jgi:acyl-CoA reductase-like NAD-dependent aldehyde dehydrogenase